MRQEGFVFTQNSGLDSGLLLLQSSVTYILVQVKRWLDLWLNFNQWSQFPFRFLLIPHFNKKFPQGSFYRIQVLTLVKTLIPLNQLFIHTIKTNYIFTFALNRANYSPFTKLINMIKNLIR